MEGTRLNKWLSEMGICSRREADRLVAEGKVTIDGKTAVMGQKVLPSQQVFCEGRLIGSFGILGADGHGTGSSDTSVTAEEEMPGRPKPVWLVVNKPRGIVCTTSDKDRAMNIVEWVSYPGRVYPVGRLDKDSEGLILMTNQGGLANQLMRSRNAHEREYLVQVDKPLTGEFLKRMGGGVELKDLGQTTRPCQVKALGKDTFQIILTQGLNRQIRRMCQTFGYQVLKLQRTRIMNICLGSLPKGKWRHMTEQEYEDMVQMLQQTQPSG